MCRKNPKDCKAKVKCKCCIKQVDNSKEHDILTLTEVDNKFEQQHYVIEVKGE